MWFLVFTGLFACAGNAVDASCPFVMKPPAVVVEYKGDFSVDCSSLEGKTEGMGWESSAGGTDLIENATTVSLHIKSAVDWTLSPLCYINRLNGSQCEDNLPVTVYKKMDSVSFSISLLSESNPMVEGKQYRVQCDIVNVAPARNLTVYWRKGDTLLKADTFNDSSRVPVNKSSVINVTADRNDNGAQISCEAALTFPQVGLKLPPLTSMSQKLTVLYPPTFTKPANETVEVTDESKLSLDCTAAGKPLPLYSWHYSPSQETKQSSDETGPILAPSLLMPGTYSCTAFNSQGSRTKYFIVKTAAGNPTTLAAIVAVFALLGVAFLAAGPFIVTPNGTFSFNKGSYQPTSSGPV